VPAAYGITVPRVTQYQVVWGGGANVYILHKIIVGATRPKPKVIVGAT
jgi:hypothetical protein